MKNITDIINEGSQYINISVRKIYDLDQFAYNVMDEILSQLDAKNDKKIRQNLAQHFINAAENFKKAKPFL